jgi:hypothetical protein
MISRKRGKNGGKELTAGGACLGGEKRTMGHGKGKKREGGVGERNRRRVRVEARDLLAFLDARAVLADICSIADPMDACRREYRLALPPLPFSPIICHLSSQIPKRRLDCPNVCPRPVRLRDRASSTGALPFWLFPLPFLLAINPHLARQSRPLPT